MAGPFTPRKEVTPAFDKKLLTDVADVGEGEGDEAAWTSDAFVSGDLSDAWQTTTGTNVGLLLGEPNGIAESEAVDLSPTSVVHVVSKSKALTICRVGPDTVRVPSPEIGAFRIDLTVEFVELTERCHQQS